MGAASARHSLRPLGFEGIHFAQLGRHPPRECETMSNAVRDVNMKTRLPPFVIPGRAERASPEPVIRPRFARTRWGAPE